MEEGKASTPHLIFAEETADDVAVLVRELQGVLLRHPIAAQAAFRALVAEGRAFAATEEGRRLAEEIVDSPLIRRGRLIWDVATLRALDDDPEVLLPSALAEIFVKLTADNALEPLLASFFEGSFDAPSE